jgi:AcrR family transcriptional regulator
MARTRYHHGDLRRALLDAALELVQERGPRGFTMREAGRRAGVSSGAPYKHFADVDALMRALALEGLQLLMERTLTAVSTASGDGLTGMFRAQGLVYMAFALEHPAYFRVMNMPEYANPGADDELAALASHAEASTVAVIEAAQAEGAVVDADPRVVALAGQALVYGLARLFLDGHLASHGIADDDMPELAVAVIDLLGTGLMPRDGGAT